MDWSFDLSKWHMRQYQNFNDAIIKEGNYVKAAEEIAKIIVTWPHDEPVTVDNLLDVLTIPEWKPLLRKIGEEITKTFSEGE